MVAPLCCRIAAKSSCLGCRTHAQGSLATTFHCPGFSTGLIQRPLISVRVFPSAQWQRGDSHGIILMSVYLPLKISFSPLLCSTGKHHPPPQSSLHFSEGWVDPSTCSLGVKYALAHSDLVGTWVFFPPSSFVVPPFSESGLVGVTAMRPHLDV